MTNRKGSLIVPVFASIFIAGAVLSLLSLALGAVNPVQRKEVIGRPFWVFQAGLSLILGIAGLIAGIKTLKLIANARILLLWVAAINVVEIIVFMPMVYFKAPFFTADKTGQAIVSPGQYLMSYIVAVTPIVIFYCIFIYFFSLPKIKNQFNKK